MRSLILLLLAACGPVVASTTHTNEGTLCLAEDGTLNLDFGVCLSSSCDSVTSQSCTVITDASGVQVESVLVNENPGLSDEDTQRVLERINTIRRILDRAAKPFLWKVRDRVGTRLRWYTEVEEVNR